jgi:hypothetical protein
MTISELITKLTALQNEWGDIPVLCAPFSYSKEARDKREARKKCWWCKQPRSFINRPMIVGGTKINITQDSAEMCRPPEPMAWGYPGLGSVRRDGNPAREVTL